MASEFPRPLPEKKGHRHKIKGCYECSRRRIDCDRSEPICQKCSRRGLQCSGLGIRFRFGNGLASRGKLTGKQVPEGSLSYVRVGSKASSPPAKRSREPLSRHKQERKDIEDKCSVQDSNSCLLPIEPTIDHINGTHRFLMYHFSAHVAPGMSVINQGFNGYRDLILPLAESDSLIRKAVLVVSYQHLASRYRKGTFTNIEIYGSLIQDLITQSNQLSYSQDQSSIIALLLLHIREIITGSDDFKLINSSMRKLLNANMYDFQSVSQHSQLDGFIRAQIFRFRLFAETILNDTSGAQFWLTHNDDCLEFLRYCLRLHPEYEELLSYLHELTILACRVYVERATGYPDASVMATIIERCKQLTENMDGYTGVMGHYLFGWPYFVLAAESISAHHRSFWVDRLSALHGLTGCGNIIKGIEQVRQIWNVPGDIRWTSLLGGPSQVFIM